MGALDRFLRAPWTPPPRLDLAAFCRPGFVTSVAIFDRHERHNWMDLGTPELTHQREDRWLFGARLGRGATDAEEDSAWAVRFELAGVRLEMVHGGAVHVGAWVAASGAGDFRVPAVGLDPFAGATKCKTKGCDPKGHPIVERYVPDPNPEVYELVRGHRVEIRWYAGETA